MWSPLSLSLVHGIFFEGQELDEGAEKKKQTIL